MITKNLILLTAFIGLFSHSLSAQQEFTWEEYGIGFTLADDFSETVNNIEEFSATGDGMEISIIPFKDNTIDDSDITTYTMAIAAYAEGVQNGVKIFVMGLIDPESETNFFVMIVFQDNDQNAIDEAINICQSIHKL